MWIFLDCSQRVFLHSSQGRSCLRLLRHSSLLSGLGGRRSRVMRRQGTCYVNLGGKSLDIFGKMPLYTLSHPLLTLRFLHLTVGILQSSPCLPFILKSKKIFLLVLLRLLNCFGEWIFSWSEVSFQKQHPHHCVCSPPEERFDSSLKRS